LACGYNLVPIIKCIESFALVINDVIFRIILIVKLIWELYPSIVDIWRLLFYMVKLQEEICINIPEGMGVDSNHCFLKKREENHLLMLQDDLLIHFEYV
jgi:hypothetical protein